MNAVPGRERSAPWFEGVLLAGAVALLFVLGGEAVRASYHGYLHASLGEAVLREGFTPENPYHAGAPLRYYTLYPALGVMLGRSGCGPLWAFAVLNVLAALLTAPALDALGRRFRLSFRARRFAFLAALVGFNGLGWLGFALVDGEPFGKPPVFVLMPLTFARESFGWDARLQAFFPKYMNVSSYALALPFGFWALASERPRRAVLPLALALALNPLVGGFAGAGLALFALPEFVRERGARRFAWILAGFASVLIALPFLLPALTPAPHGPSLTGNPALGGNRISNLFGPLLVLFVPGVLGLARFERSARWRWIVLASFAAALVLIGEMPQSNEYKMARLGGLLWALPAGAWAARVWDWGSFRRWLLVLLAIACVPTSVIAARAYLAWGRNAAPLPHGLLPSVLAAESCATRTAVIVVDDALPGVRLSSSLVQGNALAPQLHHALFVDRPQIHNEHQEDLGERLALVHALFAAQGDAASAALALVRGKLSQRPFLFLVGPGSLDSVFSSASGRMLALDEHMALWELPALSPR